MDTTRNPELSRFTLSTESGQLFITGPRGALYIAVDAFTGDADVVKFVGGRNCATILRTRNGQMVLASRRQLEAELAAARSASLIAALEEGLVDAEADLDDDPSNEALAAYIAEVRSDLRILYQNGAVR